MAIARSQIKWAGFAIAPPPFATPRRRLPTGRKGDGLRYEKAINQCLTKEYGERYIVGPWVEYAMVGDSQIHFAQPDGLLINVDSGLITIVEMKYQHTVDAYRQTEKYRALLECIFPPALWRFAVCEVVKWYDCAVAFPVAVRLCNAVSEAVPGEFNVCILRPKAAGRQIAA
jgi:hypothetical protein